MIRAMKTQAIWLGMTLAGVIGPAGCSGKIDAKQDCFKEFVQDFVLDDDEGSHHGNNVACPGQDLNGPPHYPYQRRTLHLEYSDGDYSIVQTLRGWDWDQNRQDGCDDNVRIDERVVRFVSVGSKEQFTATHNGRPVDAIDIAQYYRPSLVYGLTPSNAPVRKDVTAASIEATQFGVDCAMVDERIGESSRTSRGCRPVSPVSLCPAFDRMMPIHQSGFLGNTPVTGKTTSFKFGKVGELVNKSKWTGS